MNIEAEKQAAEIRIRAEVKTGELLSSSEKAQGSLKQGANLPQSSDTTTVKTLSDMGINKDQSSKWQKLAVIPDDELEEIKISNFRTS